jgi:hypothetical protein
MLVLVSGAAEVPNSHDDIVDVILLTKRRDVMNALMNICFYKNAELTNRRIGNQRLSDNSTVINNDNLGTI